MTAEEYRAKYAAGKIKPVSAKQQAATKRKKLEKAATSGPVHQAGYTDLVEIRIQVSDLVEVIHWVNPDISEEFQNTVRRYLATGEY